MTGYINERHKAPLVKGFLKCSNNFSFSFTVRAGQRLDSLVITADGCPRTAPAPGEDKKEGIDSLFGKGYFIVYSVTYPKGSNKDPESVEVMLDDILTNRGYDFLANNYYSYNRVFSITIKEYEAKAEQVKKDFGDLPALMVIGHIS